MNKYGGDKYAAHQRLWDNGCCRGEGEERKDWEEEEASTIPVMLY